MDIELENDDIQMTALMLLGTFRTNACFNYMEKITVYQRY